MAFENKMLSVLNFARGFTLWHYKTEDLMENLMSEYFDSAANLMRNNDEIIINAGDENGIATIKIDNGKVTLIKEDINWEAQTKKIKCDLHYY